MTSKKLFFNYMKQDLKKHLWLISLSVLTQFFAIVVFPTMYLQSQDKTSLLEFSWMGSYNLLFVVVVVVGAILSGLTMFSYLSAKDKVDFYHSLPIRREKLFIASYLNGILLFIIPCLIFTALFILICMFGFGITGMSVLMPWFLQKDIAYLLIYWIIYSIAVLAVMLTGNTVIAYCGTMILLCYNALINVTITSLKATFFEHYASTDSSWWSYGIFNPIAWVSKLLSSIPKVDTSSQWYWSSSIFTVIIWAVVLTGIALVLYCLRPSEATGCALSFAFTKPIVKCALLILFSIFSGVFFELISGEASTSELGPWMIFGFIMGCLIGHSILQVVLEFDFKAILKGRITLCICAAVSFLVICIYGFDLTGYDSYIPNVDQIESASIVPTFLVSNYRIQIDGSYTYMSDYMQKNMKLTEEDDLENVLEIVQKSLEFDTAYKNYLDTDIAYQFVDEAGNHGISYGNCIITYRLKNGRTVSRAYNMPLTSVEGTTLLTEGDDQCITIRTTNENLKALYESEQYKEAAYPILTQDETVQEVYLIDVMGNQYHLNLSEDEYVCLLRTYKSELKSLTWETRLDTNPVGVISLGNEDEGLGVSYSIYPSFTQTLDLLEWSGYKLTEITADMVDSISIYKADIDTYEDGTRWTESESVAAEREYTDKEQIAQILKCVHLDDFTYYMVDTNLNIYVSNYGDNSYQITINGKSDTGAEWVVNASFRKNTLPDFVKKDFQ
jgi:ABC-2 type transport system permease protein